MRKSFVNLSILILAFFSISLFSGCTKKDESKNKEENKKDNQEFVKTDEKGQRVTLKIKPKTGDTLRYKMTKVSDETKSIDSKKGEKVSQNQTETYYYSQVVTEIAESGAVTYKMTYDSVLIKVTQSANDSTLSQTYNSNVKDSISSRSDFLIYNNLIGTPFKIRIGANNELYDVYELESINEKIFKALGDTLKAQDKEVIKDNLTNSIKDVISAQYQEFPKTDVPKDSAWTKTTTSEAQPFPFKNIVSYKVKDINIKDGNTSVIIEAKLDIEFLEKETKSKEGSMKILNVEAGGTGTTDFDLSKGCLNKKNTSQKIDLEVKISSQGQTAKLKQNTTLSITIDKL
jgi:hypothetical protein